MGAAARSNLLIMWCISSGPGAGMEHRGKPGLGFCSALNHLVFFFSFYFIDLGLHNSVRRTWPTRFFCPKKPVGLLLTAVPSRTCCSCRQPNGKHGNRSRRFKIWSKIRRQTTGFFGFFRVLLRIVGCVEIFLALNFKLTSFPSVTKSEINGWFCKTWLQTLW